MRIRRNCDSLAGEKNGKGVLSGIDQQVDLVASSAVYEHYYCRCLNCKKVLSSPFSASIRRTSMRDKAKLSWKEARQEADTCALVVPTADGDSLVEEVVKTPVWMTAVEASRQRQTSSNLPSSNSSNSISQQPPQPPSSTNSNLPPSNAPSRTRLQVKNGTVSTRQFRASLEYHVCMN